MNILFLTLYEIDDICERGIYSDLLRSFLHTKDSVYVAAPTERRMKKHTYVISDTKWQILRIRIGNIQKTNILEKGISTILIERQFKKAIKKYYSDIKFDLIIYSTPPITFANVIRFVKKRDNARSYLLLKDIFPQNSVDLGILSKTGIKKFIYKFFRNKEKRLYELSDRIGCMSQANCDYILKHNPKITSDKVEICPNSIEVIDMSVSKAEKNRIRIKYGLPVNDKIFVYGGNLGKPQNVPFIVECIEACKDIEGIHFVVAGSGTDRHFLEKYVSTSKPNHITLFDQMPKDEYDKMVACCDVGMIFLDHRFTIPNFPSRLLSYMQARLPVLACTDVNTDIGEIITNGGFGWWCESDDKFRFKELVANIDPKGMGEIAYRYLLDNYNVKYVAEKIMKWML